MATKFQGSTGRVSSAMSSMYRPTLPTHNLISSVQTSLIQKIPQVISFSAGLTGEFFRCLNLLWLCLLLDLPLLLLDLPLLLLGLLLLLLRYLLSFFCSLSFLGFLLLQFSFIFFLLGQSFRLSFILLPSFLLFLLFFPCLFFQNCTRLWASPNTS